MAMTATISVVGNAIMNQPNTCVVTVSNSGGSNVNVTGISPWVYNSQGATLVGAPVRVSDVFVAPGTNSAGSGTNQLKVAVTAGGTATFIFSVVAYGPSVSSGFLAQPSQQYLVGADIVSDDGSEFAVSYPQIYAPALPGRGQAGGNTPDATAKGEMQFNQGANSYAFVAVTP